LYIPIQSAELKKQKVSEIKEGIEEAEALVSSSLCILLVRKASFISSLFWLSDKLVLVNL